MKPKIQNIEEIKLIGMSINHSLSDNKTIELWQKFMPRKKEMSLLKNSWNYAIQQYDVQLKMQDFTFDTKFEIWAAVEMNSFENIPSGMNSLVIPAGQYAMFIHKGNAQTFPKSMAYIMNKWLPESEYKLDERAHFQIMKDEYLGENNPNSEEEIWIPVI